MTIEPPKIDERTFSRILENLKRMSSHYTPEWAGSSEQDSGVALLKVFSYITEAVIHRFNQAPRKSLVAFLDMLGIKLLPARATRVPLVFTLTKGTEKEILVPARAQAVADKTAEHDEIPSSCLHTSSRGD